MTDSVKTINMVFLTVFAVGALYVSQMHRLGVIGTPVAQGQVWRYGSDNPFVEYTDDYVIAVSNGWVQYVSTNFDTNNCSYYHSSRIPVFKWNRVLKQKEVINE